MRIMAQVGILFAYVVLVVGLMAYFQHDHFTAILAIFVFTQIGLLLAEYLGKLLAA